MMYVLSLFSPVVASTSEHFSPRISDSRFKNAHMGVSKNRGTPKWMVYNGSKPY